MSDDEHKAANDEKPSDKELPERWDKPHVTTSTATPGKVAAATSYARLHSPYLSMYMVLHLWPSTPIKYICI